MFVSTNWSRNFFPYARFKINLKIQTHHSKRDNRRDKKPHFQVSPLLLERRGNAQRIRPFHVSIGAEK